MDLSQNMELAVDPAAKVHPDRGAATLGYFGAWMVFGLISAVLGPTLPGLAKNVGTTISQISLVFTAQALGYLGGALVGGRLFDRIPGNRLLGVIMLVMGLSVFLVPLIGCFWVLILVFVILGSTHGSLEVGANTIIVWMFGRKVGPYMNAMHFFFGVGAILSPIIVARIIAAGGDIRWAYWLLGCAAIPVAVWLGRLSSPKHLEETNTGEVSPTSWVLVALIALLLFLYVAAEVSFGGWIYTYTVNTFGPEWRTTAAVLTSAFWGALTFGRLVSIPLALRLQPKTVLVGDLLGCLVSIGLIALLPGSVPILWIGTIGLGFFMAAFFPTTVTLAGQRVQLHARVSSWFFVGAGAGGMVLPWVIGQLFESIGPGVVTSLIFVDLLATLAVLAVILWLPSPSVRRVIQMSEGK